MLKTGIIVLVIGILLGAVGGGGTAYGFVEGLKVQTLEVPSSRVPLKEGTHTIYERVGTPTENSGFSGSTRRDTKLGEGEVTITSQSGTSLPIDYIGAFGANETYTKGSTVYRGVAKVEIPASGTYEVEITERSAGEIIVGKSIGNIFRSFLPFVAVAVLGGLMTTLGLALIIVHLVKRSSARTPRPVT